jgi:hypothetical protein
MSLKFLNTVAAHIDSISFQRDMGWEFPSLGLAFSGTSHGVLSTASLFWQLLSCHGFASIHLTKR